MHRSCGGQRTDDRGQRTDKDDCRLWRRLKTWRCSNGRIGCRWTSTVEVSSYRLWSSGRWRSRKSICANLAEGFGRQGVSTAEFKRFVMMAMGSADEMRLWCRYCLDLGYIDAATWQTWRQEYREIAQMLQGLHRSWR